LLTQAVRGWPYRVAARRLLVTGSAALVAVTAGCAPAAAQLPGSAAPTPQPRVTLASDVDPATLEVSGTGEVVVPADRTRVSFAVETEGKTAGEAARTNADAMDAAIAALRASGAEGILIETHGYGLHPRYANRNLPNEAPRIVGYRAVNTVTVTTTDVDAVGGLIDTATAAGVNRVASLVFDATDTDTARREALAAAVRQARGEATAIADALGVPLGRVLKVRGGAQDPGLPPRLGYAARGMAMEVAATPVEAGSQTIRASVTITFALDPS